MAWTLCLSGSAILDAGANANADSQEGASFDLWSDQSEGRICAECHYDFVTNFAGLDTEIQFALQDVCSAMIAMKIVGYDTSGYSSNREAETILDVLDERVFRGITILKVKTNQKLGAA